MRYSRVCACVWLYVFAEESSDYRGVRVCVDVCACLRDYRDHTWANVVEIKCEQPVQEEVQYQHAIYTRQTILAGIGVDLRELHSYEWKKKSMHTHTLIYAPAHILVINTQNACTAYSHTLT